mmetsp:Transcript_440/g.1432  ORF Transcript_440/g.1432 Transcript_440/m.1432 type:complete len:402 (-) Transcript_440:6351-7556(-)
MASDASPPWGSSSELRGLLQWPQRADSTAPAVASTAARELPAQPIELAESDDEEEGTQPRIVRRTASRAKSDACCIDTGITGGAGDRGVGAVAACPWRQPPRTDLVYKNAQLRQQVHQLESYIALIAAAVEKAGTEWKAKEAEMVAKSEDLLRTAKQAIFNRASEQRRAASTVAALERSLEQVQAKAEAQATHIAQLKASANEYHAAHRAAIVTIKTYASICRAQIDIRGPAATPLSPMDRLLQSRRIGDSTEYLVRWAGNGRDEEETWETASSLVRGGAIEAVLAFERARHDRCAEHAVAPIEWREEEPRTPPRDKDVAASNRDGSVAVGRSDARKFSLGESMSTLRDPTLNSSAAVPHPEAKGIDKSTLARGSESILVATGENAHPRALKRLRLNHSDC